MLETLFVYKKTTERHQNAPLLKERECYLHHCFEQGYSHSSLKKIANMLFLAVKYLPTKDKIISLDSIRKATIKWRQLNRGSLSKRWLPKCKKHFVYHVTQWLMFVGKLQLQKKENQLFPEYLSDYIHYMRNERGWSESTISMRHRFIQTFLSYLRSNNILLSKLRMNHIDNYFLSKANQHSRHTMRMYKNHLRAFLSFAEQNNLCKKGLREAIILPRIYRNESLPISPTRHEVYQLISSTNGNCPKDIRNKAILMLLIIYGLRSSEIAKLRLTDIDWKRNIIHLKRAKNSKLQEMPLIESVRKTLIRYITDARPCGTPCQEVFISNIAPYKPLKSSAITALVTVKWHRLQVKLKHYGAHSLRYACATHLINQGVSLKAIGDLLGHNNLNTTLSYTKVDIKNLRKAANINIRDLL